MGLFLMGMVMGGVLTAVLLAIAPGPDTSRAERRLPEAPLPAQAPALIALEPTGVPAGATAVPLRPRLLAQPGPPARTATGTAAPTPLLLLSPQPSEVIGYSMEARPLEVYRFGDGQDERMIVAGIHGGDEWNTITLANQLVQHLNQNPGLVPDDITLYILPSLNPDGEARAHTRQGRLNSNGVDLNRNFPVNWKADWDRAGCWNYLPASGGSEAGSEIETQALMGFIQGRHIRGLISYHSAGLGVFPGGLPWDEGSIRLAQSIAGVTTYPFPPLDTGCAYSGTLADYAVSMGAAAVDLELTNHFDTDFEQNLRALDVLLTFAP